MTHFAVDVTLAGSPRSRPLDDDDDRIGQLSGLLAERLAGAIEVSIGAPRISATLEVEARSILDAGILGVELFRQSLIDAGMVREVGWRPVRVEMMTKEEQGLELSRPLYDLVGVTEIGQMMDVSRQRASVLARSHNFPRPVVTTAAGDLWQRWAVEEFGKGWERKPGRPAKPVSAGNEEEVAMTDERIAEAFQRAQVGGQEQVDRVQRRLAEEEPARD
jgi:hypothetical protein